jgi:amidase
VKISGDAGDAIKVQVFVDGEETEVKLAADGSWSAESSALKQWTGRQEEKGEPSPEKSMVIVVATGRNGRSTGKMGFV